MQNRFKPGDDIDGFHGQSEDEVVLEPIFDDVLGERSREGLSEFAKELDEFAREAAGFLKPRMTVARLPVRAMFLKGVPYVGADNEIIGNDASTAPPAVRWRGNESQQEALNKAFKHKVSLVWGPAATGKSEALANIMVQALLRNRSERILCVAPRNVPVDSLCKRAHTVYKANHPGVEDAQIPFVRLFSESQMQAQNAVKDKALNNPYHIANLRMAEARRNPARWTAYRANSQEMRDNGFIADDKQAKDYARAASELTRIVVDRARVVFCTTAVSTVEVHAPLSNELLKQKLMLYISILYSKDQH